MVILSPSSLRGKKKKMSYSRKKLLAKSSRFNTVLQNCTLKLMIMYLVKSGLNLEKNKCMYFTNLCTLQICVFYDFVFDDEYYCSRLH